MPATNHDPAREAGHEALLVASPDHRRVEIRAWIHAATARRDTLLTLAAPPGTIAGEALPKHALPAGELPFHTAIDLTRRALDDGFHGLSIIVWVDRLTAATSATVHAGVEATLSLASSTATRDALERLGDSLDTTLVAVIRCSTNDKDPTR
jgi:hypothetical protein